MVECTGLERQCKTLVTTRNQGKLISVQKSVQNVLFYVNIILMNIPKSVHQIVQNISNFLKKN